MSRICYPAFFHVEVRNGQPQIVDVEIDEEVLVAMGYFHPEVKKYLGNVQTVINFLLGDEEVTMEETKAALRSAQYYDKAAEGRIIDRAHDTLYSNPRETLESSFRRALLWYGSLHFTEEMKLWMTAKPKTHRHHEPMPMEETFQRLRRLRST